MKISSALLESLNVNVPRYTSYPTVPFWKKLEENHLHTSLLKRSATQPLSLYFHIPFCHSMCLYCGCSVILNRRPEREAEYVRYLEQELKNTVQFLSPNTVVNQIHFGGGTPTKLSIEQLSYIIELIHTYFCLADNAEIAIEVDPRTVFEDGGVKLRALRLMGFNRVSFGVQDSNEKVQEVVKRRQSWLATRSTFEWAKDLQFRGINIDLIYGLPLQTVDTFEETMNRILGLAPDRLALFSYAKVPHIKPHQKAIPEQLLPSTDEKFAMYSRARHAAIEAGYTAIGMDHFASQLDPLSKLFRERKMYRNFQGYTVYEGDDMLGFGVTAISYINGSYYQNDKDLVGYYKAVEGQRAPTIRGIELSADDRIRRYVINRLMCDFRIDVKAVEKEFSISFKEYFKKALAKLQPLEQQGLLQVFEDMIEMTSLGELFCRNIASCFDAYMETTDERPFSKAI